MSAQPPGNGANNDVIQRVWSDVINIVNRILDAHKKFGFEKIQASLNPSLEDMIHGLAFIDFALNELIDSGLLNTDETRQALNSRQCMLHFKRLSAALDSKNEEEYAATMRLLETQPLI